MNTGNKAFRIFQFYRTLQRLGEGLRNMLDELTEGNFPWRTLTF
jgi:hypothetical protein